MLELQQGEPRSSRGKNLSPYQCAHHKHKMDGPGPNPGPPGEKLMINYLRYDTAFDIMLVNPGHYDI